MMDGMYTFLAATLGRLCNWAGSDQKFASEIPHTSKSITVELSSTLNSITMMQLSILINLR